MKHWFNATRATGEPGGPGEFVVEDSDGNEGQVRCEYASAEQSTLIFEAPVVCLNKPVQRSDDCQDIINAVRQLMDEEPQLEILMLDMLFKVGDKIGWIHNQKYNTGIVKRFLTGSNVLIASVKLHSGDMGEARVHEFNRPRLDQP